MKNDKDGDSAKWSVSLADAHTITADGDAYDNPPDIASFLNYIFGGRGLSELLQRGTAIELERVHILLCARALDESLPKINTETVNLFTFSAMEVAKKLSLLTGKNWVALEPDHEEEALENSS